MARSFLGMRSPAVYTLEDMADDAAALLDHLGIDRAHIVGGSMGGMIAQIFAARFPERTKTLGVIFSSNNQAMLPPPGPEQLRALLQRPADSTREAIVANAVRVARIIGSPGYPRAGGAAPRRRHRGLRAGVLPRGHRPPLRRGAGQRQPAALRPPDQGADRGDPRQGRTS